MVLYGAKNPAWKGGQRKKRCKWCGKDFWVYPSGNRIKCCSRSCSTKLQFRTKGHPHWKGGNTEKVCLTCGKRFEVVFNRRNIAKYCSHQCYAKALTGKSNRHTLGRPRYDMRGSKNPLWKGGITPLTERIRRSKRYKSWVWAVYQRDRFVCQITGKRLKSDEIIAHHIVSFSSLINEVKYAYGKLTIENIMSYEPLWDIENGITLSRNYHLKYHQKVKSIEIRA